ncbi:MAG: M23 family metallopeptidase, partial [Actinomycetia bacterium]|nr:M23 family metallopeptidase [Actinomycetes bacterium]
MLAFSDSRFRLLGRLLTAILAMITFSAVLAMPAGAEDPPGDGQPADPQPGEGQTADQQPAEGIPSEPVDTPVQPEPEPTTAVDQLVFPIVGPVTYSDTWGACRGYRCYRSHKGVDIFGTKLAPLVAVTDGIIISTRRTALTSAGNKVIIEDDDGWRYIYLHLNNDSPGTDDGANPQGWIIPNRLR